MFHRTIQVDQKTATPKPTGSVLRLLRDLFGKAEPRDYANAATSLTVAEKSLHVLRDAGFRDVLSATMGSSPIYVDDEQSDEDMDCALAALAQCDGLGGPTPVLLVLSREHAGLHSVVTLELGESLVLRWSSRIVAFRVAAGERPAEYRRRVRQSLASGAFSAYREQARTATEDLIIRLRTAFGTERVNASTMDARVVLPGPTQVGRLRHLGFGGRVRGRTYHAIPKIRRRGAYDDPHVHHFYDPYHDLLSWILVRDAAAGLWHADGVEFVDIEGKTLEAGISSNRRFRVSPDAVTFHEDRLEIAEDIPATGFDTAEAGSPDVPGWAGENFE